MKFMEAVKTFIKQAACDHRNAWYYERTGVYEQKKNRPPLRFRIREYHCPDCGKIWWKAVKPEK